MGDNVFNSGTCGAIRGTFSDTALNPVIVLSGNEFNTTSNIIPILSFSANSSSSFPIVIDANTFYGPGSSSSSAIMINNITGGVIKNNVISDFNISVLALSSGMDLYNNTMTSPTTDCILSVASGSILDMKPSGGKLTAGFNSLSTTDEGANNVEVYDSYFYVNGGFNTFDLVKEYTGYHLTGYFPASEGTHSLDYNCFTEDGSDISPVYNVTWGSGGDPVSFGFNYDCNAGEGSGYSSRTEDNLLIVPVTDYYNDTIIVKSGNYTLTTSDSMSIETRKRNYEKVIDLAESILENDPGSREAVDAVSKLYLASLRLDSAGSKMTALKAFLEQLILNNGNKPDLVKRAFYFIQKCKSALGQYQSAMTGFEDIVNNNPNTYDALVASWDYAATSLLLNGGSSGGNRPIINVQSSMFSDEEMFKVNSFDDDPDDRSKLTKEQKPSYVNTPEGRQQVKVNVIKSFEETRKEEINVINNLRDRSEKGDRSAKKELRRREILQDVVKKRQPNDIYEHINDVSSDIRTVFNSTDDNSIKKEQNSVPTEFELSQNFPNPFNPATKIQYALPHDGKVQLVIYDILGREVVKLVNNEFRTAGRYISEFNGSRLASGVYFYRIMVNEGKDFNKVKKMVLVK
ncbi:MAG: T9SS type A sorting domain-containing protein [Ignavibacteriae bacterium]|nr:T9SS type A sorting domain-containing protein [Ignavibacteriota bacterium]